jgi:hypothetical protein
LVPFGPLPDPELPAVQHRHGGRGFRRNTIIILMCLELMLNSVNLLLVAFSAYHSDPGGQVIVFFIMLVAAAEVTVGLGDPGDDETQRGQRGHEPTEPLEMVKTDLLALLVPALPLLGAIIIGSLRDAA